MIKLNVFSFSTRDKIFTATFTSNCICVSVITYVTDVKIVQQTFKLPLMDVDFAELDMMSFMAYIQHQYKMACRKNVVKYKNLVK